MSVVRRLEFATADPARVGELLGNAYGTRVRLLAVASGATMRQVIYDAGSFNISETTLPGRLRFACEPVDAVFVAELTAGRLRLTCGRRDERLAVGRPLLGARRDVTQIFQTRDARVRQLAIGTDVINAVAGTVGDASIQFRGFQPPSDALARTWRQTAEYVARVVSSPAADSPLVVAAVARTVAAAILVCFPDTVRTARCRKDQRGTSEGLLRRAVEFVDENFYRDIGVSDIARAVHVTPRTVQLMFRRHLGTTPTGYLRRVRLDQAHRDLTGAKPASASVSEIAARWGFAHPGRFSALYRQAYGHAPNVTLRGG
ncbi:helix-turn-helix transcriptional regulator [Mycobacterium sp. OAE908]|uniref:helix-turn-helix transcriptional regulator n=1 Tax=Mycobacterium sp. OAE908 TaxID=2817899 RepID=UPI001AE371E5